MELKAYLATLTEDTSPSGSTRYVPIIDSTGSVIAIAKLDNLPSGGIGGTTGSVDNRVLRADGTGGATVQSSALTIDDSGNMELGSAAINGTFNIFYGGGVKFSFDPSSVSFVLQNAQIIKWQDIGGSYVVDIGLKRFTAGVLKVTDGSTGGGALAFQEQTAPSAPAADNCVLFAQDNGSGKTQLCVRFPTGSVQVISTEP